MNADKPRRWPRWRFASRIARREVRRRPGRTLLVSLLIALPIFGMTLGDILYRTNDEAVHENYQSRYGTSDVVFEDLPADTDIDSIVAELPGGFEATSYGRMWAIMATEDGLFEGVDFSDLPIDDPLTEGIVEIHDGRAPAAPDELFLAKNVADELGVSVGDTIDMSRPAGTFTVVGSGQAASDFDRPLAIVGSFPFDKLPHDQARAVLLISGADEILDVPVVRALAGRDGWANGFTTPDGNPFEPEYGTNGVDRRVMAWAWVAGAIVLGAVGIIIAAAFATSARRQLQTLGQLSANGAEQGLLTRTVVIQGAWLGMFGSIVGSTAGVALLYLGRGQFESLIGHRLGDWRVGLVDLAVIGITGTLAAAAAAWIPARSIARVPVLSALAGRRPLRSVPRWMVPTGLVAFAGGSLLLFLVAIAAQVSARGNLLAATAVLGGIGVMAGVCLVSPGLVSVLGPLGRSVAGTAKLAARNLARNRARTAAVITAIAIAGGISVVGSTAVASDVGTDSSSRSLEDESVPYLAYDMVYVGQSYEPASGGSEEALDEVRASIEEILGEGTTYSPLRYLSLDPQLAGALPVDVLVADKPLLDSIGMSPDDQQRLKTAGVMTSYVDYVGINGTDDGSAPLTELADEFVSGLPADVKQLLGEVSIVGLPSNVPQVFSVIVSEDLVDSAGASTTERGLLAVAPEDLDKDQRNQLEALNQTMQIGGFNEFSFEPQPLDGGEPGFIEPEVYVQFAYPPPTRALSDSQLQALIVGFSLIVTMGIVTIALALAAAEGREERDVLVAVGAKPSSMRRLAGIKAWWMALRGGVLAVPVGFVPTWIVISELPYRNPVQFPWVAALLLLLVVPVVAAIVAWAGSSIAQWVKPVTMSTSAVD